jgi:outer membrane protein OmpA-like peptidoglycan-associated protein
MTQAKKSTIEFSELDQGDLSELDRLVDLLADLNVIDHPQRSREKLQVTLAPETFILPPSIQESIPVEISPAISVEAMELIDEALPANELDNHTDCDSLQLSFDYTAPPQPIQVSEDPVAVLEKLQALLLGPELADLNDSAGDLRQQVAKLNHQIYDPTALMTLLMPWVAELLSRKIKDSEQDMVQAIAPIIDQIIHDRIQQDQGRMSDAISPVLPSAIHQQVRLSPEKMATALAPSIGQAIKEQIEIESDSIVDALYPIIGGTIAKYMAETLKAINTQIEEAVSPKGIQRKIRAKLQGVSEAELILKDAVPFAIQAAFLIHKTSGLVIAEVQRSDEQRLESDMLGGMLTAIRSFVNDCIFSADAASELDEIDYGMSKIILEVAGYCYLAIVVKGEPPKQFSTQIRQLLGKMVSENGAAIAQFDGDPAIIPQTVPDQLDELIGIEFQSADTEGSNKTISPVMLIGIGLVSIIALPWGFLHYRHTVHQQAETAVITALSKTPELAVYRLAAIVDQDKLKLTGDLPNTLLRQKAEKIAQTAVPTWQLKNEIVAVEVPPDPVLTAAEVNRTTQALNQMEGVKIIAQYKTGSVKIDGIVNKPADAHAIAQSFQQIPGVKTISSEVEVQPLRIDTRFYFEPASAMISPVDRGYKVQQAIVFLQQYPHRKLKLIGYSNPQSSDFETQTLALERAKSVRDTLIQQGVDPSRLQVVGASQPAPDIDANQALWLSRCVILIPV